MAVVCAGAISAHADIITVTNTNDSGPGSLRQALADANDGDTIDFTVTGTIGLTSDELEVNSSISISGPGANSLAVSNVTVTPFRVFHLMLGHTVTIQSLTISGGYAQYDYGGGIFNDHATLTVTDCMFTANYSGICGGAIYNDSGTVTVINNTISGNLSGNENSGANGAGICSSGVGATLTIVNSVIAGNSAYNGNFVGGYGGGIAAGALVIDKSTISANRAGFNGGGISSGGPATITNSTINGNQAGFDYPFAGAGGGIFSSGKLMLSNCTISGNNATGSTFKGGGFGGGIYGTAEIRNRYS